MGSFSACERRSSTCCWRLPNGCRNGAEVDLIVEGASGRIAGIGVEASSTVAMSDMKHLRYLDDRLGDRFIDRSEWSVGATPLA